MYIHSLPDHIPRSEFVHLAMLENAFANILKMHLPTFPFLEELFILKKSSHFCSWLHTHDGRQSAAVPETSTPEAASQAVLSACGERWANWSFTCLTPYVHRRDLSLVQMKSEDPEAKEIRRRRIAQAVWFKLSLRVTSGSQLSTWHQTIV